MRRCLKNNDHYDYVRNYVKLTPVRLQIRKLADPHQPIHIKRKLVQAVPVGKVVIEDILLSYVKLNVKTLGRKTEF